MAITQTYADYATGNDYKGASFTDGAYTSATKTLVKANAFTASKVNHWLYLESNDGGSIVAGYYKIATWTDASTVILATDAGAGVDDDAAKCTQHDGTTSLPWRSVQGAFDLITRDATNGDQVNVKAGTTQVNQAALTLATYGTPTAAAPLVIRGYTSAANDGGRGAIQLASGLQLTASGYNYISLIDLDISGAGAATQWLVNLGSYNYVRNCTFTAGGYLHALSMTNGVIHACYATGCTGYSFRLTNGLIYGNYAVQTSTGTTGVIITIGISSVVGNIVVLNHVDAYGIDIGNQISSAVGNIVYNRAAGTKIGVRVGESSGLQLGMATNNIVCGFSGAGGVGISSGTLNAQATGYNAFWNNTTNESYGHQLLDDLGGDVSLAADPFTDAANGDFSLTAAAKTALAAKGFPLAYLGAHANTVPNLNIGPIQMAAGGGSSIFRRVARLVGG